MSAALGHSAISGGRRSHRPRSVRARDAAAHVTLALALLALAVGAAACGGQALTEPEPVVSGPEAAADALRRVQLERRVAALREGWAHGVVGRLLARPRRREARVAGCVFSARWVATPSAGAAARWCWGCSWV
jgi:hypothetical protein